MLLTSVNDSFFSFFWSIIIVSVLRHPHSFAFLSINSVLHIIIITIIYIDFIASASDFGLGNQNQKAGYRVEIYQNHRHTFLPLLEIGDNPSETVALFVDRRSSIVDHDVGIFTFVPEPHFSCGNIGGIIFKFVIFSFSKIIFKSFISTTLFQGIIIASRFGSRRFDILLEWFDDYR
jgi:hypothetical protein